MAEPSRRRASTRDVGPAPSGERRKRTVVVGKAEKAERERRRAERARRRQDEEDAERVDGYGQRDVPDVEQLRQSRAEYYGRPLAQRETEKASPMVQEVRVREERDKEKRREKGEKGRTRTTTRKERSDPTAKKADKVEAGSGKMRRSRTTKAATEDRERRRERKDEAEGEYVYRSAPARRRSEQPVVMEDDFAGGEPLYRNVMERRRSAVDDRLRYGGYDESDSQAHHTSDDEEEADLEEPSTLPGRAGLSAGITRRTSQSSTKVGSRTASMRSTTARSRSKQRSNSRARSVSSKSRRPVRVRHGDGVPPLPPMPPMPPILETTHSVASPTKEKKRASFLGGFFAAKAKIKVEPAKVECLTCASEVSPARSALLACGHNMCHTCLKHIFTMSVTDPQHMPPRCCAADHIPLKYVAKLFDDKFKVKWNKKYEEYTTQNRLYCPSRGCGAWISPQHTRPSTTDPKRTIGTCPRCKTRTCGACGRKWHTNADCNRLDKDADAREFAKMATAEGWQRCYNCTATVELKEGCNHMTCRCGAQFCMICGVKWKGCDCPWFNLHSVADGDRLPMPNDLGMRQQAGFADQMRRRRDQEREDEDMARRMQGLEIRHDWLGGGLGLGGTRAATPEMERDWGGNDTFGFGNAAGHFLNDRFVQRATRILTGAFTPEAGDAAERLVLEIRRDRAPPLPATAVLDPFAAPAGVAPPLRRESRRVPPGQEQGVEDLAAGHGGLGAAQRAAADRMPLRRSRTTTAPAAAMGPDALGQQNDGVDGRRRSVLAGLAPRPGWNRVDLWRQHIDEAERG